MSMRTGAGAAEQQQKQLTPALACSRRSAGSRSPPPHPSVACLHSSPLSPASPRASPSPRRRLVWSPDWSRAHPPPLLPVVAVVRFVVVVEPAGPPPPHSQPASQPAAAAPAPLLAPVPLPAPTGPSSPCWPLSPHTHSPVPCMDFLCVLSAASFFSVRSPSLATSQTLEIISAHFFSAHLSTRVNVVVAVVVVDVHTTRHHTINNHRSLTNRRSILARPVRRVFSAAKLESRDDYRISISRSDQQRVRVVASRAE